MKKIWFYFVFHGWYLFRGFVRKRWSAQHPEITASPEGNALRTAEVKFYCLLWQWIFWGIAASLIFSLSPATDLLLFGRIALATLAAISSGGLFWVLLVHGHQILWLQNM